MIILTEKNDIAVNLKVQICQVTCIWWVTPTFLYFHLFSPAFCLNHPQPSPFCLMETILSWRTFSQEEKQKTSCRSIQIWHQISYLCSCAHVRWLWINFSTYSDSLVIWCSKFVDKHWKNSCRYCMKLLLGNVICAI